MLGKKEVESLVNEKDSVAPERLNHMLCQVSSCYRRLLTRRLASASKIQYLLPENGAALGANISPSVVRINQKECYLDFFLVSLVSGLDCAVKASNGYPSMSCCR